MDESTQKMQSRQQLAGRAISHSYPTIRQEDIDAVVRCLTSRQLVAGDVTRTLEQTVAATMGYRYAAATINGSQALHLALRALPNPKSRRVGLQSYLCRTMYDATVLAGCDPQLLDLKENSFSISPEEALRANVATVIVPHMFGIRTEVEKFRRLRTTTCSREGLVPRAKAPLPNSLILRDETPYGRDRRHGPDG